MWKRDESAKAGRTSGAGTRACDSSRRIHLPSPVAAITSPAGDGEGQREHR